MSAAIRTELARRAAEFNILIDDVALTHLSFSTEVGLMGGRRAVSCDPETALSAAPSLRRIRAVLRPRQPPSRPLQPALASTT